MSAAATVPNSLGQHVRALRDEAGLSQRQLGVSVDTVWEIEHDVQLDPKISTLRTIAGELSAALGRLVTVGELIGEPDPAVTQES